MADEAPPPLQSPARTSRLAVASLVLGILGCTSIVGLVLGIVGLVKINNSQGRLRGRGLAIAGICVSAFMVFVGIPAVATLAGFALPALAKAKEKAQYERCLSNMQQLAMATRAYAGDSGNRLPNRTNWCEVIRPYLKNQDAFYCPASKSSLCSYGYNAALSGRSLDEANPRTVIFFEMPGGWNESGGPEHMLESRHRKTTVVHLDGSLAHVQNSAPERLRWDP
jgi:hypothetical protein